MWNRVVLPDYVLADARQPCRHRSSRLRRPGRRCGLALGSHRRQRRLTTLLGIGAELARAREPPGRQPRHHRGARQRQDSINPGGSEITRRNMDIQPTPDHCGPTLPVRVIVNRDLVLRPVPAAVFNRDLAMSATKLRLRPLLEDRDRQTHSPARPPKIRPRTLRPRCTRRRMANR